MKARHETVRILVTGAGALLGQGILRALRKSELQVFTTAVDVSPLAAGLYWADERYLVPPAVAPDYLDAIRAVIARTHPDVVLIGTDVELAPLARVRPELEREFGARVLVSSPEVVAIADDKYETARFFTEHGFAAPASALASDREAVERLIAERGFPLIVKPCVGARSYGVSLVESKQALQDAASRVHNAVVQEYVGEAAMEYTASGLCFDGVCDAVIVMRRDLRDGNTYRAFTVDAPELDARVKAWTEALQPFGPVNFQFRIDPAGEPKVFEINARFSGTTPLRAHAGFDEVAMCIRKILWNEPITQPAVRPLTILRHWSETVVSPEQPGLVRDAKSSH
jgi:carbamoyl-phosphate synthase large subunit